MTDIEFLDPGPWQPPEPAPGDAPPPPRASRLRLFTPPALWTAAAVLALLAPFRMIYALTVHVPGLFVPDQGERADGWGRVHVVGDGVAEHAVRYGIISCVAAALLVAAAGVALVAVVGRLRVGRAGFRARLCAAGLGIAATALLAGVAATTLLSVQALHDNVVQAVRPPGGTDVQLPAFEIRIGWMVWLTVIAVACGLLALLLQALPQRAPTPAVPSPPPFAAPGAYPADPEPGPYPDDELLDTHPKR